MPPAVPQRHLRETDGIGVPPYIQYTETRARVVSSRPVVVKSGRTVIWATASISLRKADQYHLEEDESLADRRISAT
jgi:hypothetical protein